MKEIRNKESSIVSDKAPNLKSRILLGLLALVTVGMLAGCSGTVSAEAVVETPVPAVAQQAGNGVVAEAVIEPAHWSELRVPMDSSGEVVEVLVNEGDVVSKGDLLVRLDPTDAELAIQQAEAAISLVQAQLARVKAGSRPEEIAVTEARLAAMEAALSQAVAHRNTLANGEAEAAIVAAQAALATALAEQKQSFNQHEQTMVCYDFNVPGGGEKTICPALGTYEEQARFALHAADDGLEAAQLRLAAAENQAVAGLRDANAGIQGAEAQRDATEAQLELQRAGSQPERIASAEAQVARAEAALAAAEAAMARTFIRAPFDGVVVKVHVDTGDTSVPGQVLVLLASSDRLQVRTKDLTELDVVRVAEGQPVVVTLDALPGRPLAGHVVRVGRQSEDYRGDPAYPVTVELDEDVLELRWGMTAMVEIDTE
ncbi:MAG: HlyD family efflux transporter periplasmic adaptor subunit [Chloroflexi bacterium]|nr:HlyD family efflux transporter periplasmic adaptor subunit [Chloroflexota bacterium]